MVVFAHPGSTVLLRECHRQLVGYPIHIGRVFRDCRRVGRCQEEGWYASQQMPAMHDSSPPRLIYAWYLNWALKQFKKTCQNTISGDAPLRMFFNRRSLAMENRMKAGLIVCIILGSVSLTGCQQARVEQRHNQNLAYCNSIGATGNAFAQCMMNRDAVDRADDQIRAANQASAMSRLNQQMILSQPPRPQITNCNRTALGMTCTTF